MKRAMKFLTHKQCLAIKPSPHYAKMAAIMRERRLEVEDDDTELIDMTIQECNRLLDLSCFLGRSGIQKAGTVIGADGPRGGGQPNFR